MICPKCGRIPVKMQDFLLGTNLISPHCKGCNVKLRANWVLRYSLALTIALLVCFLGIFLISKDILEFFSLYFVEILVGGIVLTSVAEILIWKYGRYYVETKSDV